MYVIYTIFFMSVLMLLLLKVYYRVCEMTHMAKHLPCSHKDLSLIPRTLGAVWLVLVILALGRRRQLDPGACWVAHLSC